MKTFFYGVSTSAFQIEGDNGKQGRGKSVWDEYCRREDTIFMGQDARISTDHYNKYRDDVALMRELGINAYRFSISWPRIFPGGIGKVNVKGADFYDSLIDELLKYGIEPMLTLYHWDLPEALSQRGGFFSPEFPKWFEEYSFFIVKRYGKRVKWFIPFNEPINAVHSSYHSGMFAPGHRLNEYQTLLCMRNMILAHMKSAKLIADEVKGAEVGTAMSTFEEYPAVSSRVCIETTKKLFFEKEKFSESVDVYLDPLYLGRYPERVFERYPEFADVAADDDIESYSGYTTFVGANNYSGTPIGEDGKTELRENGFPMNSMGSAVDHNGLYWECKFLAERYNRPIVITENGMACDDIVSLDGKVHDSARVDYLARSLNVVERLREEGVDLRGYFIWSFMDNFEWLAGYSKRFGIVYTDYRTLERIPKDSYYFVKEYLKHKT